MPIFQYTAMDASGKEQKGQHEAASEEAVAVFLKEQGMFPTSIKPLAKAAKAKVNNNHKILLPNISSMT